MALVLRQIYRSYHWLFNEFKGENFGINCVCVLARQKKIYISLVFTNSDGRVEDMPLIGSPFPILALLGAYVYFVTIAGPKFMENRKPYNLKSIIQIYNLIQIVSNLYIGVVVRRRICIVRVI